MIGKRIGLFGLGLLSVTLTTLVFAQIEEVIVTAQKRAESIQDVPISMAALTGAQMDTLEIKRAQDIVRFMPNVAMNEVIGDTQVNYYIRGVGEGNFHSNSVGAVGLYLDGVALNSPVSSAFAMFDMERVEVLRGPQNALFGKNTTGGAINYISRKPEAGDEMNGFIDFTYGRWDQMDIEAAWGGSVSETVAFRISGVTQNRDENIHNRILNKKEYDIERHAARAQIAWEPNDSFDLLVNIHGGVNRGENRRYVQIGTKDPTDWTQPCQFTGAELQPGVNCADGDGFVHGGNWNESFSSIPNPRNDIDVWGASLTANWDMGWATLASISAYESNELRRSEDSADSPGRMFQFSQETELDQWSQELRLTSSGENNLRWIAGWYYFYEENHLATIVRRTPPGVTPTDPALGRNQTNSEAQFTVLPSTVLDQENTEWALYGQAEFDATEQLTVTIGGRFSSEEKEGFNHARVGNGGGVPFGDFIGESNLANPLFTAAKTFLDYDVDEWGGRVSVDYRFNDDLLGYVSASRGFKGGGFSVAALQAIIGEAARNVEQEILVTYEAGFKSSWMDGTVQFNAALFMNEWKNQQIFSLVLENGVVLPLLLNIPATGNWGADLDVVWSPGDGWYAQAGLGFLDSEVQDATDLPTIDVGNDLPYNPNVSFVGLLRKDTPIGNGMLSLQTDMQYTDSQTFDIENKPENGEKSTFEIAVSGTYTFGPEDKYNISVFGRNLTSEKYCLGISDLRGGLSDTLPCTMNQATPVYGASARVNWN